MDLTSQLQVQHRELDVCGSNLIERPTPLSAVNVSVPEEMDAKLTKDIIKEYGLECSASMVQLPQCCSLQIPCVTASYLHTHLAGSVQEA